MFEPSVHNSDGVAALAHSDEPVDEDFLRHHGERTLAAIERPCDWLA